jgi:hypothetical protein
MDPVWSRTTAQRKATRAAPDAKQGETAPDATSKAMAAMDGPAKETTQALLHRMLDSSCWSLSPNAT